MDGIQSPWVLHQTLNPNHMTGNQLGADPLPYTSGRSQLGVPAGAAAVVSNGRVVVLHDEARGVADGASAEDLGLLQMVAESSQLSNQAGLACTPSLFDVMLTQHWAMRLAWSYQSLCE